MPLPFEIVNAAVRRGPFRAVVFDFDGTLSLVREGWAFLMAELGRDHLAERQLIREPESDLLTYLEREMLLLSGKPSIFQMRRLAEEVTARGGVAPDAEALLEEFLRRLFAKIETRLAGLRSGAAKPADWCVPGSHDLLDNLQRRGVKLYLASGTDRGFVESDMKLLDLERYFGPRVYAPANNTPNFSKGDVIAMILRDEGISGDHLLGFGDGYSETVEVKRIGGVSVGVASTEPSVAGLNAMKRDMLIGLGADVIVPDYREQAALIKWLWA
ncbi:HAD family hydrolase [Limnoglobus roseus]|uniref:phosphoglycolate phosphatase n=1 Tax=Limnoglobus roseus TaxID=2598579 RepID=A0A5C1A616_9BACT|nr:HAD family hydrolase [Limnoglobus roseus]QEL13717.1 HAD family hydrolase [Limnoglobus roseus]